MNAKSKGLGRGLETILKDTSALIKSSATPYIEIDKIETNPFQPRKDFDETSLQELAESIKNLGIIQPITVRKLENGNYQLISGERRLRAAKLAGLKEVPCFVRSADDNDLLELALVENVQRDDLNAIDVAISLQRMIEEFGYNLDSLSSKIGKNKTTISNYIRLLKLPADIQLAVRENKITMGHARAIINIDNPTIQLKIFKRIIEKSLSVRQTEELVSTYNSNARKRNETISTLSDDIKNWISNFSKKYNTKVNININSNGKGKIIINFKNSQHLMQILNQLDNLE